MPKPKTNVWDHFVGLDDTNAPVMGKQKPKFAKCKLCEGWKQFPNAVRMAKHLRDVHFGQLEQGLFMVHIPPLSFFSCRERASGHP